MRVINQQRGQRQRGFSLVELMVSVLLGLVVVGAAVAVYLSMVFSSTGTVRSARLNYDMGSLMLFMTNDLRRAGYSAGVFAGANPTTMNPFTTGPEDITIISDWDAPGSGRACIVYSYDSNDNGTLEDAERFGFRLNDDGSVGIRLSSGVVDCDSGTWERITVQDDSEVVQITDLQFSFVALPADTDGSDEAGPYPLQAQTSSCDNVSDAVPASEPDPTPDCSSPGFPAPASGDALVARRIINIRMTGQMGRDQEISRSLVATVKVANDRLWVVP